VGQFDVVLLFLLYNQRTQFNIKLVDRNKSKLTGLNFKNYIRNARGNWLFLTLGPNQLLGSKNYNRCTRRFSYNKIFGVELLRGSASVGQSTL
jgi:hypothetical protein